MNNLFLSSLIILALDCIWINTNYFSYKNNIELIQKKEMQVKLIPTIIAYILLILAMNLCLYLGKKLDIKDNIILASTFGFIIYGIYNSTNMALLDNYKISIAIKDTLWGTFLLGITMYIIKKYFKN